jgi:hypothetical protein
MKKIIAISLLAVSLTACGNYNRQNHPTDTHTKNVNGVPCIVTNGGGISCNWNNR